MTKTMLTLCKKIDYQLTTGSHLEVIW